MSRYPERSFVAKEDQSPLDQSCSNLRFSADSGRGFLSSAK
jgi:hypothetical protein